MDAKHIVDDIPPEALTVDVIRRTHSGFEHAFNELGGFKGYEVQCIGALLKHIDGLEHIKTQLRAELEALEPLSEAAQTVVDRWDTPLWKDAPATAQFINALRNALPPPR